MQINMGNINVQTVSDANVYWFKSVLSNIIEKLSDNGFSVEIFSYKEKDRYVLEAYKNSFKLKVSYIVYDYLGDVNKWHVCFLKKLDEYEHIINPKYFNRDDIRILKGYINTEADKRLFGKN